jgi:hypothetical protein
MPDEAILREKARAAVQEGKLPVRAPDRVWGGRGAGTYCTVCELTVTPEQTEFEIEFVQASSNPAYGYAEKFHLHIRCFAAWELERRRTSA